VCVRNKCLSSRARQRDRRTRELRCENLPRIAEFDSFSESSESATSTAVVSTSPSKTDCIRRANFNTIFARDSAGSAVPRIRHLQVIDSVVMSIGKSKVQRHRDCSDPKSSLFECEIFETLAARLEGSRRISYLPLDGICVVFPSSVIESQGVPGRVESPSQRHEANRLQKPRFVRSNLFSLLSSSYLSHISLYSTLPRSAHPPTLQPRFLPFSKCAPSSSPFSPSSSLLSSLPTPTPSPSPTVSPFNAEVETTVLALTLKLVNLVLVKVNSNAKPLREFS